MSSGFKMDLQVYICIIMSKLDFISLFWYPWKHSGNVGNSYRWRMWRGNVLYENFIRHKTFRLWPISFKHIFQEHGRYTDRLHSFVSPVPTFTSITCHGTYSGSNNHWLEKTAFCERTLCLVSSGWRPSSFLNNIYLSSELVFLCAFRRAQTFVAPR